MVSLPEIVTSRIAFKLSPKAEVLVKKGHPWIFENSIVQQKSEGKSGDLAIIFDNKNNKFLACGLYDPDSPIRIKVLQPNEAVTIDKDWFNAQIERSFNIRKPLLQTDTNSYRLIYGENDHFPGLIADVYNDVIVVKLYYAIWFPYLKDILPLLLETSKAKTMVLRLGRNLQKIGNEYKLADGEVIFGQLDNEVVVFKEHGINFSANVIHGHKTGYFLDHRENRRRVGEMSKGKTVLDVFSYAGGFSVHALAGGATEVVSIDISAKALEMAKENTLLNPFKGKHITMAVDAFEGMQQLIKQKKKFDIVVIDPPSFAKQKSEVEKAKFHYNKLAELSIQLVKSNGTLVMASCSSRITSDEFFNIIEKAFSKSEKQAQLIEKTYHDIDHPIAFEEGAYLKCGYYEISK